MKSGAEQPENMQHINSTKQNDFELINKSNIKSLQQNHVNEKEEKVSFLTAAKRIREKRQQKQQHWEDQKQEINSTNEHQIKSPKNQQQQDIINTQQNKLLNLNKQEPFSRSPKHSPHNSPSNIYKKKQTQLLYNSQDKYLNENENNAIKNDDQSSPPIPTKKNKKQKKKRQILQVSQQQSPDGKEDNKQQQQSNTVSLVTLIKNAIQQINIENAAKESCNNNNKIQDASSIKLNKDISSTQDQQTSASLTNNDEKLQQLQIVSTVSSDQHIVTDVSNLMQDQVNQATSEISKNDNEQNSPNQRISFFTRQRNVKAITFKKQEKKTSNNSPKNKLSIIKEEKKSIGSINAQYYDGDRKKKSIISDSNNFKNFAAAVNDGNQKRQGQFSRQGARAVTHNITQAKKKTTIILQQFNNNIDNPETIFDSEPREDVDILYWQNHNLWSKESELIAQQIGLIAPSEFKDNEMLLLQMAQLQLPEDWRREVDHNQQIIYYNKRSQRTNHLHPNINLFRKMYYDQIEKKQQIITQKNKSLLKPRKTQFGNFILNIVNRLSQGTTQQQSQSSVDKVEKPSNENESLEGKEFNFLENGGSKERFKKLLKSLDQNRENNSAQSCPQDLQYQQTNTLQNNKESDIDQRKSIILVERALTTAKEFYIDKYGEEPSIVQALLEDNEFFKLQDPEEVASAIIFLNVQNNIQLFWAGRVYVGIDLPPFWTCAHEDTKIGKKYTNLSSGVVCSICMHPSFFYVKHLISIHQQKNKNNSSTNEQDCPMIFIDKFRRQFIVDMNLLVNTLLKERESIAEKKADIDIVNKQISNFNIDQETGEVYSRFNNKNRQALQYIKPILIPPRARKRASSNCQDSHILAICKQARINVQNEMHLLLFIYEFIQAQEEIKVEWRYRQTPDGTDYWINQQSNSTQLEYPQLNEFIQALKVYKKVVQIEQQQMLLKTNFINHNLRFFRQPNESSENITEDLNILQNLRNETKEFVKCYVTEVMQFQNSKKELFNAEHYDEALDIQINQEIAENNTNNQNIQKQYSLKFIQQLLRRDLRLNEEDLKEQLIFWFPFKLYRGSNQPKSKDNTQYQGSEEASDNVEKENQSIHKYNKNQQKLLNSIELLQNKAFVRGCFDEDDYDLNKLRVKNIYNDNQTDFVYSDLSNLNISLKSISSSNISVDNADELSVESSSKSNLSNSFKYSAEDLTSSNSSELDNDSEQDTPSDIQQNNFLSSNVITSQKFLQNKFASSPKIIFQKNNKKVQQKSLKKQKGQQSSKKSKVKQIKPNTKQNQNIEDFQNIHSLILENSDQGVEELNKSPKSIVNDQLTLLQIQDEQQQFQSKVRNFQNTKQNKAIKYSSNQVAHLIDSNNDYDSDGQPQQNLQKNKKKSKASKHKKANRKKKKKVNDQNNDNEKSSNIDIDREVYELELLQQRRNSLQQQQLQFQELIKQQSTTEDSQKMKQKRKNLLILNTPAEYLTKEQRIAQKALQHAIEKKKQNAQQNKEKEMKLIQTFFSNYNMELQQQQQQEEESQNAQQPLQKEEEEKKQGNHQGNQQEQHGYQLNIIKEINQQYQGDDKIETSEISNSIEKNINEEEVNGQISSQQCQFSSLKQEDQVFQDIEEQKKISIQNYITEGEAIMEQQQEEDQIEENPTDSSPKNKRTLNHLQFKMEDALLINDSFKSTEQDNKEPEKAQQSPTIPKNFLKNIVLKHQQNNILNKPKNNVQDTAQSKLNSSPSTITKDQFSTVNNNNIKLDQPNKNIDSTQQKDGTFQQQLIEEDKKNLLKGQSQSNKSKEISNSAKKKQQHLLAQSQSPKSQNEQKKKSQINNNQMENMQEVPSFYNKKSKNWEQIQEQALVIQVQTLGKKEQKQLDIPETRKQRDNNQQQQQMVTEITKNSLIKSESPSNMTKNSEQTTQSTVKKIIAPQFNQSRPSSASTRPYSPLSRPYSPISRPQTNNSSRPYSPSTLTVEKSNQGSSNEIQSENGNIETQQNQLGKRKRSPFSRRLSPTRLLITSINQNTVPQDQNQNNQEPQIETSQKQPQILQNKQLQIHSPKPKSQNAKQREIINNQESSTFNKDLLFLKQMEEDFNKNQEHLSTISQSFNSKKTVAAIKAMKSAELRHLNQKEKKENQLSFLIQDQRDSEFQMFPQFLEEMNELKDAHWWEDNYSHYRIKQTLSYMAKELNFIRFDVRDPMDSSKSQQTELGSTYFKLKAYQELEKLRQKTIKQRINNLILEYLLSKLELDERGKQIIKESDHLKYQFYQKNQELFKLLFNSIVYLNLSSEVLKSVLLESTETAQGQLEERKIYEEFDKQFQTQLAAYQKRVKRENIVKEISSHQAEMDQPQQQYIDNPFQQVLNKLTIQEFEKYIQEPMTQECKLFVTDIPHSKFFSNNSVGQVEQQQLQQEHQYQQHTNEKRKIINEQDLFLIKQLVENQEQWRQIQADNDIVIRMQDILDSQYKLCRNILSRFELFLDLGLTPEHVNAMGQRLNIQESDLIWIASLYCIFLIRYSEKQNCEVLNVILKSATFPNQYDKFFLSLYKLNKVKRNYFFKSLNLKHQQQYLHVSSLIKFYYEKKDHFYYYNFHTKQASVDAMLSHRTQYLMQQYQILERISFYDLLQKAFNLIQNQAMQTQKFQPNNSNQNDLKGDNLNDQQQIESHN